MSAGVLPTGNRYGAWQVPKIRVPTRIDRHPHVDRQTHSPHTHTHTALSYRATMVSKTKCVLRPAGRITKIRSNSECISSKRSACWAIPVERERETQGCTIRANPWKSLSEAIAPETHHLLSADGVLFHPIDKTRLYGRPFLKQWREPKDTICIAGRKGQTCNILD